MPVPVVPFLPTPRRVVQAMLELGRVTPRDLLYDLGAGDGRILEVAHSDFGARAHGIELNPMRVRRLRERATRSGTGITVEQGSFYNVRLHPATVLTLYLTPAANRRLAGLLRHALRPGTRILSHDYPLPGWRAERLEVIHDAGKPHYLYLYRVPGTDWGLQASRPPGRGFGSSRNS